MNFQEKVLYASEAAHRSPLFGQLVHDVSLIILMDFLDINAIYTLPRVCTGFRSMIDLIERDPTTFLRGPKDGGLSVDSYPGSFIMCVNDRKTTRPNHHARHIPVFSFELKINVEDAAAQAGGSNSNSLSISMISTVARRVSSFIHPNKPSAMFVKRDDNDDSIDLLLFNLPIEWTANRSPGVDYRNTNPLLFLPACIIFGDKVIVNSQTVYPDRISFCKLTTWLARACMEFKLVIDSTRADTPIAKVILCLVESCVKLRRRYHAQATLRYAWIEGTVMSSLGNGVMWYHKNIVQ